MGEAQQRENVWTVEDAARLYRLREWSAGYFDVAADGKLIVRPRGADSDSVIVLPDVVRRLQARGLEAPLLLRFPSVIKSQVCRLNDSFVQEMQSVGYRGAYCGVYPVKVNQHQQVVEEVLAAGKPYHHGLEIGSKAELIAAVATLQDPEALLVCNGYKDEEFVELALHAARLGMRVILVVELPSEIGLVLACAQRLHVEPELGLRVRLSSRAGGHWTASAGDQSRFGLSASQITTALDELRAHDALGWVRLLHYHLGSQIPDIGDIRTAVREAARFYVDLVREGARMGHLDVGGGLAVDYEGCRRNSAGSSNYGMTEYCADIVEGVASVMDEAGVEHPAIVSESGRAVVAYHSVLVMNILESKRFSMSAEPVPLPPGSPAILESLASVSEVLHDANFQECYHDALFYLDELRSRHLHGKVSLRERALGEQIFTQILTRIAVLVRNKAYLPQEMENLDAQIADVYYGNFSVFQSAPDAWAIDQIFPVVPVQRLNEEPTRNATLADITCDCDGKIDRFIDPTRDRRCLPVHELGNEDYYLGLFLVGAYQETLGDLHNLLGHTHVVGVDVDRRGEPVFTPEILGGSVADVLTDVNYDPDTLIMAIADKAEKAVTAGRVSGKEQRRILDAFETGLRGYTYFER